MASVVSQNPPSASKESDSVEEVNKSVTRPQDSASTLNDNLPFHPSLLTVSLSSLVDFYKSPLDSDIEDFFRSLCFRVPLNPVPSCEDKPPHLEFKYKYKKYPFLSDDDKRRKLPRDLLENWFPTYYTKSEADSQFLLNILNKCTRLTAPYLEEKTKLMLVNSMKCIQLKVGEIPIRQGDITDICYFIERGEVRVTHKPKADASPEEITVLRRGDAFGELALLYYQPRTATCEVVEDATLWTLDRLSFRGCFGACCYVRLTENERLLQNIGLFDTIPRQKVRELAVLFYRETLTPGQYVYRQNQVEDQFYIVESGLCRGLKEPSEIQLKEDNNRKAVGVRDFKQGDYFGEFALMGKTKRRMSVVAIVDTVVLILDREAFEEKFGFFSNLLDGHKESRTTHAELLRHRPVDVLETYQRKVRRGFQL